MTCKYNYKNVSLKTETYTDLKQISEELSPNEKLSPAKTIENLVYLHKSLLAKPDGVTYAKTRKENSR